jgi:phosphoenolpyruvate synthase/pyruvate phosphate dikinase
VTKSLIVPLDSQVYSLEIVGGKDRSLAKLTNAGFDVPDGFKVTTQAYRQFVAEHDLQSRILEPAKPRIVEGHTSFEQASSDINSLFHEHSLNDEIVQEIVNAYENLQGTPAIAVRSSANAEDLTDLSFDGHQDTYLNVKGADEVAAAVKNCCASLWTAQSINYRHEMDIQQDVVAKTVIEQIMIPSEVSGILFTANPASGDRDEMIINCSFGLGETVVIGQVTPDTYIVDRQSLKAKETIIGAKDQMIVSDGNQVRRMEDVTEAQKSQLLLADAALV